MNSQLRSYWPLCICIPSYIHSDIPIAVTHKDIHSLTLHHTVTTVTALTFVLWLCYGFGCAYSVEPSQLGGCVCHCEPSLLFGCLSLIMQLRIGLLRFELHWCCLYQFEFGTLHMGFLDQSVSQFFYPSLCCVSITFEVH